MTDLDDLGTDDTARLRDWQPPAHDHGEDQALGALHREIQHLRDALASQPVIDQAKGALMFRYGVDADTAFGLLVRWSQNTNTKLRDLATALVLSLSNGSEEDPALAHEVEQLLRPRGQDGQEPSV